ncbi:MAG TPA: hypothetical protein VLE22_16640 [Bryobacteraceae bacterium]|nr:hypothetical protein [Bryobacteraceae bacterium]
MRFRAISCLLLLGFALAGCRSRAPETVKIDEGLAKLVPQDAVMLAGTRMEEVRATTAYKLWGNDADSPAIDRFARDTGFDPRKDIRELLVASDGEDTVFLARGAFAPAKLEQLLAEQGARKSTHRGQTVINNGEWSVAFLDTTTAVAGGTLAVQSSIDRRLQGGGGIPAILAGRMKAIPKDSQLWIVTFGLSPALARAIPERGNMSNLRRLLSMVESASAGVDLRSGFSLNADAVGRTAEDAKFIHDAFRGLVGMGRLTVPDNEPEMLRFYDAIGITQKERTVRVQAAVPMDVLEKLAAKMRPRASSK